MDAAIPPNQNHRHQATDQPEMRIDQLTLVPPPESPLRNAGGKLPLIRALHEGVFAGSARAALRHSLIQ